MRLFFRNAIPARCRTGRPAAAETTDRRLMAICGVVLAGTLMGFFTEAWTGVPAWLVAFTGAAVLFSLYVGLGHPPEPIVRGIGWDVIVFVLGIFIIVVGVRNAGFTHVLGDIIETLAGKDPSPLAFATSLVAAVCSSIMNNHPTAGLMTWVIQDFSLSDLQTKMLVFAALIGGDLGPKMLPVGSLAALMWFRMLRDRGVDVPYTLYVRIGVPVTLAAIVCSVVVLNAELHVATALGLVPP
jgi:arsenical pump membrane protein